MKHNTVMSILDSRHGVDRAVVVIDPALIGEPYEGCVVGKWIETHVGQTDWATLWDWTEEGRARSDAVMTAMGGVTVMARPTYQTASGRYSTKEELLEGMTFGRHGAFKPGEWLTALRDDGYLVIEVI